MTFNNRYRGRGRNRRGRGGGRGRFNRNRWRGNHVFRRPIVNLVPPVCVECDKAEPPYKCPRCFKRYCSVACCQEHKKQCPPACSDPAVSTTSTGESNLASLPVTPSVVNGGIRKNRSEYKFPTKDTVPLEKLVQMKDNERIKSLLKSAKLRALITRLDDMRNPTYYFRHIMKDPEFRAFSNAVLEAVGVADEYNLPHSTTDSL